MKLLILLSVLSLSILACNTPVGDGASSLSDGSAANGMPSADKLIMSAGEVRADLEERQQDPNAARWRAHHGTKYRFWGEVLSIRVEEEPTRGCFSAWNTDGLECLSEWLTSVALEAQGTRLVCLFKGDKPAGVVELDIGNTVALEGIFDVGWTEYAGNFRLYDCRVIESNFQPTPTPVPTPTPTEVATSTPVLTITPTLVTAPAQVPATTLVPTPTPLPFSVFETKVAELTKDDSFRTMLVRGEARSVLSRDTAFNNVTTSAFVEQGHWVTPGQGVAYGALVRLYPTIPNEVSLVITCWEDGNYLIRDTTLTAITGLLPLVCIPYQ